MSNSSQKSRHAAGIQGNVLAVILSASTSKGGDLLFRYPCQNSSTTEELSKPQESSNNNQFFVRNSEGYREITNQYSDKVLSTFLTVYSTQSDKLFDVKVDDVQFLGYTVTIMHSRLKKKGRSSEGSGHSTNTVNVVFALPETISDPTKDCYHQLAKQIAMAIKHEERRCCYFCSQRQRMTQVIEEAQESTANDVHMSVHPSTIMLEKKISLAVTLKNIYEKVSETGVVLELMNNWTEINFCLPIKAHNLPFESELRITEADIDRCLDLLRPYHAMLLLVDSKKLIAELPIDSSPALIRILRVASPRKNLQCLAADSDLELTQVFKLVSHLVYWAKATIIYPLCETNVYVLSPNAPTSRKSDLVKQFQQVFPGKLNSNCLTEILSDFSLPLQLNEHSDITDEKAKKHEKVEMVTWMLQRRILMQLHTYLYLKPSYQAENIPTKHRHKPGASLNDAGKGMLQSISDPKNEEKFLRLCRYFDGTHHLEEIMLYENMARTDLLNIIDRHLPMLYKMQFPDPATSYYAKTA